MQKRARSHKKMTFKTDKHAYKGMQIQRQSEGKNYTPWVNSGRRTQEDKDKQIHKYTDTQTRIQKNTKTHLFQVRTQPHTHISSKNLTSWVNSGPRAQEDKDTKIQIC